MSEKQQQSWRGIHLMGPASEHVPLLERAISEVLAPLGINQLILEINYGFEYRSHPELRGGRVMTREDARRLTKATREQGIRLIPMFNCLGHQSWAKETFALLKLHPEFDETPQIPLDNPDIYCRSWCPQAPGVNDIIFALIDELVDAFESDAFHVGMDEVFLIASDQCPRCQGKDPADMFALAVNDLHRHLAGKRKQTMLMWGDRLLDDSTMHYGEWEASRNGTAPAIDRIPKDIVQCDWHYEPGKEYPSVPFFQEKGFTVWPSSWRNKEAALALLEYSRAHATDRMVGHLCTTWAGPEQILPALLGTADPASRNPHAEEAAEALRACMHALRS
jgi:hypothetical protein